jgi:hypothetical protein
VADGMYATPVPLQIFAYRSAQLAQVNMARTHLGADTLLGARILELLRIRSAQLGECEPCSQSRKHDSITDEDVACLLAPGDGTLTPQEQMAVEFMIYSPPTTMRWTTRSTDALANISPLPSLATGLRNKG